MTPQRITLITLGVASLARARGFYTRWGWTPVQEAPGVVFFDLGGFRLGLYCLNNMAAELGCVTADLGTGAVTLAQNYHDRDAVDAAWAGAVDAGAHPLRLPCPTDWGGYAGYVTDPDGHVWELAHNPHWPLDNEGWLEPLH